MQEQIRITSQFQHSSLYVHKAFESPCTIHYFRLAAAGVELYSRLTQIFSQLGLEHPHSGP
jgi:hypothetical protein